MLDVNDEERKTAEEIKMLVRQLNELFIKATDLNLQVDVLGCKQHIDSTFYPGVRVYIEKAVRL